MTSGQRHVIEFLSALTLASIFFLPIGGRGVPTSRELANILPPEPILNAHAYFAIIIGAEKPLLKRREWKKLPPASLTKLLTAVVASEVIPPENPVVFSKLAKKVEPKSSGAAVGEIFSRDDTMRLALMESANDAATALAETTGINNFVEIMNNKARSLGLLDSVFKNPTGLDPAPFIGCASRRNFSADERCGVDEEGNLSTAEDLVTLAEYIWNSRPELLEITRAQETEVFTAKGKKYQVKNTNELLKEFPAILGGKTGFTDNAKGALLLLYPVRPDKIAIIVLLGSEDRFGDGRKIISWLENLDPTNY